MKLSLKKETVLEKGDNVIFSNGDGYGVVVEIMPKNLIVVAPNRGDREIVLNMKEEVIRLLPLGDGYRLIGDDEPIREKGDEYWAGDMWNEAPTSYRGDRYRYFFRRKK